MHDAPLRPCDLAWLGVVDIMGCRPFSHRASHCWRCLEQQRRRQRELTSNQRLMQAASGRLFYCLEDMKKLILAALLAPSFVLAQTFPSPTFNSLTLQNPLTAANGGTGSTGSTGTGSVVLNTSPTLVTPALGTPSSVTLTNAVGLPLAGLTGLGAGVSAGLASAATGTGGPVFSSAPTISSLVVTGGLTAAGLVTTSDLATQAANTILGNGTSSVGSPTALAVPSCSATGSALTWVSGTGFGCAAVASTPVAATNAALKTVSTASTNQISRLGFSALGDTPPLLYTASASVCSLNSGAGDNGSQVQSADGLCWIASFPGAPLDVTEWGVKADGLTDNTTALQAAWTYGGTVNTDILLPPSNYTNFVKFSSLTAPVGTAGAVSTAQGPLSAIRGRGVGQTVLKSTVTGQTCAISFNAPSSTYSADSSNRALSDFQLIALNSGAGEGICLNQITGMTLANFNVQQFENGLLALDAIKIRLESPQFLGNINGINAGTTGQSFPNQWVIINPYVNSQVSNGFLFKNGADIDIYGGDFEINNFTNTTGNAVIVMSGNPVNGKKGLSVFGGYYSENGGSADFLFIQLSTDGAGSHGIYGVEQDRALASTFTAHAISLVNNQGGSGQTNIDVRGSAFWSTSPYVQNPSRTYISVASPTTANYHITGYDSNYFMPGVEAPVVCQTSASCMSLPDGHIEQWGQATSGSTGVGFPVAITWPVACPTAVDSVITVAVNAGATYSTGDGVNTTTGATLYSQGAGQLIGWRMICH